MKMEEKMAKPVAKSFLNFENSPVSQEVIDKAVAEQKEAREKQQALKYAQDIQTCQNIVDAGKKHLKRLRKTEADFLAEFKLLETAKSADEFAKILNASSIRNQIGTVNLVGEYDAD